MADLPRVHAFMGKFMELPRDHVRAYVVELPDSVVVVDATLALSSAGELRTLAESFGKPMEAVLLTHGHPDHYTGLARFGDLPRFASEGCLEFARSEDVAKAGVAKSYLGDDYPDERIFPDQIVQDGARLTFGGVPFTFTDTGPAESDSDGMWVFEADGVKHAFVGDTIADRCHCFFRDGHSGSWLKALDRLESTFDPSTRFYVGHAAAPPDFSTIAWQRGYIQAFRDAVGALPEADAVEAKRETQEDVVAAMQAYLPGETTLFLLDYELDVTIPALWKELHGA